MYIVMEYEDDSGDISQLIEEEDAKEDDEKVENQDYEKVIQVDNQDDKDPDEDLNIKEQRAKKLIS